MQKYDFLYDPITDTISFRISDEAIAETDVVYPGVLADIDTNGCVVGYEILQASRRFPDPQNADVDEYIRRFEGD